MMKGTSNLMMALTLVLVVSLAVVLALVLVLLAELYCSLLLRRRQLRHTATVTPPADEPTTTADNHSSAPSLTNIYAQGVLAAPRSILYPALSGDDVEKQQFPPPPENQGGHVGKGCSGGGSGRREEGLVYISNPVFDDGENGRRSKVEHTPFETPDTSPSRLETEEDSDNDEREEITSSAKVVVMTPPLTPMKRLPAEARSAPVKDGRSVGTSGGDSNSNNGVSSSSSSGTPCTSLSW